MRDEGVGVLPPVLLREGRRFENEAIREIAETPLEPYAGVHFDPPVAGPPRQRQRPDDDDETRIMPPPPVVGMDDDRTQLLGEDDRTLAAPGPPPPDGVPPSRAFPPRPPLKQPRKRRTGLIVWTVVLLALAAVAYWAWMENTGGGQLSNLPDVPAPRPEFEHPVGVEPVVEPDAGDALLLNEDGKVHYLAEAYDSAAINFRLAVQIEPDNPDYRRNLGLALRRLGEYEESVQHLRRATELNPTLLLARFDLGGSLLAMGDTAAALDAFARFADQSSTDSDLAVYRNQAIGAIRRVRRAQAEAAAAADTVTPPPLPVPDSIVPVLPSGGNR